MNFYQSVLFEKKFLENISKKVRFWGNYLNIYPFWSDLWLQKLFLKI